MRVSNLFLIILIFVLFFIASCTENQNMENMQIEKSGNEDSEFKKMCQDAGYEWMYMKQTQDGKIIQDSESCWGCMVEGIEHVCDKEKFMEYVK